MLSFKALFQSRLLKRMLTILERGDCLSFSFHPYRQGEIRLALGSDLLHITWYERSKLRSLQLNDRMILLNPAKEKSLIDGLLARADVETIRSQSIIESKLPFLLTTKIKRSCSVTAQRLSLAIEGATTIRATLNPMGYGEMSAQIGTLRIHLSVLERGKSPALTINGRYMFAHKADIRHVAKALSRRQRLLSRRLSPPKEAIPPSAPAPLDIGTS